MKFQTGKTYTTRSIGDADCIFEITIAKRTEKTITTTDGKSCRVYVYEGAERVMPMGRYSMAPVFSAEYVSK